MINYSTFTAFSVVNASDRQGVKNVLQHGIDVIDNLVRVVDQGIKRIERPQYQRIKLFILRLSRCASVGGVDVF